MSLNVRFPKIFSSLRHYNFRLFWFGQMISLSGTWMQNIALSWLVLDLTNSSFLLGLTNAIAATPILLFSLVGGVVADRVDKRKLITLTQILSMLLAFSIGILISLKVINFWHIVVNAGLLGLVNAFDGPCRQSFVVEMVGKEDINNAVALNSLVFNIARILGPMVAGFIVASFGIIWCFYFNGISFIAVIIGLLLMKGDFSSKNHHEDSVLKNMTDGARYVWSQAKIRSLIILAATSSIFGMSYLVLMPIFARDILKVGPQGLGILVAFIGMGAILGAATMALFSHHPRKERLIFWGGLMVGVSLVCFALSKTYLISLLFLMGVGWGLIVQTGTINAILQVFPPDNLRGRVMGFYIFMFLGMTPIGSFQAGLLAHYLSTQFSVVIGGVVYIIIVLLVNNINDSKGLIKC